MTESEHVESVQATLYLCISVHHGSRADTLAVLGLSSRASSIEQVGSCYWELQAHRGAGQILCSRGIAGLPVLPRQGHCLPRP